MKNYYLLLLITIISTPALKAQITLSGSLTGPYSTLSTAFNAINSGGGSGVVTVTINASTTETIPAVLNQTFYTVTIQPSVTATINGNLNTDLIVFNGADNVLLNGLNQLTIQNQNTGPLAGTLLLTNDASGNVIQNTKIKGSGVSNTHAVVNVVNGSGTTGCDNNSILNNEIMQAGSNKPGGCIFLLGTSVVTENNNNIIEGNKLHDYFNPSGLNAAVGSQSFNSGTIIRNNSIYQTSGYIATANNAISGISILDGNFGSGSGFQITGNYIGGRAPGCGGAAFTISGDFETQFAGILLYANGGGNLIENNTIKNLNLTCIGTTDGITPFIGIAHYGGDVIIGSIGKPNRIGSVTGTGSIVLNHKLTNGNTLVNAAILDDASVGGAHNCLIGYNQIGGITLTETELVVPQTGFDWFYGILAYDNPTLTVSYNTIGSSGIANSILATGTGTLNGTLAGMYLSDCTVNAHHNIIKNISNNNTGVIQGATGVVSTSGNTYTFTDNEVANLSGNPSVSGRIRIDGFHLVHLVGPSNSNINISDNNIHHLTVGVNGTQDSYCHAVRIINSGGAVSSASGSINNNIINNIINNGTPQTNLQYILASGIFHNIGYTSLQVNNNSINTISCANAPNTNASWCNVAGVAVASLSATLLNTSGTATISGNTIYNLSSGGGTAVQRVRGIFVSAKSGDVIKNKVYNLSAVNAISGSALDGIYLNQLGSPFVASYKLHNNLVTIGIGHSTPIQIQGIASAGGGSGLGSIELAYNSVFLSGNASGGTMTSAAYARVNSAVVSIRNNLFYNARTGGSGNHVAIRSITTLPTGWPSGSCNYNFLVSNNVNTVAAIFNNIYSFNNWQTVSSGDVNSETAQAYVTSNPSNLFVDPTTGNLSIQSWLPAESGFVSDKGIPVSGITNDYFGNTRNVTNPDIGAHEFSATNVVWNGSINTNWHNATNWTPNLVPNVCGINVLIPNVANDPVVSSLVSVGNLTINSGAKLTLNDNLLVCGNWIGGSSSAATMLGNGKVILGGALNQSISNATLFNTLQLDNTAGAEITSGNTQINTAIELKQGNLKVSNANFLTFLSTSTTHCAVLDNFSTGFNGTFMNGGTGSLCKAQRRYAAAPNVFNQHYMGSPMKDMPLSQFAGLSGNPGFVLNSVCSDDLLDVGSPYGNVYQYDESNGANCAIESWYAMGTGSVSENGRGYLVKKSGAGTLTVSGTPNVGSDYTKTGLTNTGWTNFSQPSNTSNESGWHFIGNAYLAALDLDKGNSYAASSGMDAQVQFWNEPTGSYIEYMMNGSEPAPVSVAPFQGFFVHTPGGGSFTLSGDDRSRAIAGTFYQQANDHQLSIYVTNDASGLNDRTMVSFSTAASNQFDGQYDANKLPGLLSRHTLYTVNNNSMMSRNTLHSIEETSTVDMNMYVGATGNYTMSFDGISSFDPTSYIMLEDKQLNVWHNAKNGNYTFSANATDNKERFVLHFTPKAEITANAADCNTNGTISIVQPGTANWTYTIANTNGTVATGTLNQNNPIAQSATPGVYTVTLVDNNYYTVVKQVQVIGATPVAANMTASANTAEVAEDISFSNTTTNVTTTTWNFGDGSTATTANATHNYQSEGVYNVTLTTGNADGCQSSTSQTVTVTAKTISGIGNLTDKSNISIWSNENKVYVDLSQEKHVEAVIEIYNIIGQQLSMEKFGSKSLYSKQLNNLEAAYVIVKVFNDDRITTKKVFISGK